MHANWPLFHSTLDQPIVTNPHIRDHTDLEHSIQDFSAGHQAAFTTIPQLLSGAISLLSPLALVNLMKLKNYEG